VAVDPTGRFVYVRNFSQGTISGFTISATSGALALIPGSPFPGVPICYPGSVGECVSGSIAVDPTGKFAYVTTYPGVSGYSINASTGALTAIPGSPFATRAIAVSIVVEPTGEFAYGTTYPGVLGYSINATTGALTLIAGSPFGTGTCRSCDSVALDPSGRFAYWGDYSGGIGACVVYGNTINATTGALTAIPGSPFFQDERFSLSIAVSGQIH
jgi:6-phosphogluconolactonase (cycloisomerase 2 family)